jgi:hypothetical protein
MVKPLARRETLSHRVSEAKTLDRYCAVTVWSKRGLEADNQAYLQKAFRSMAFCKALYGNRKLYYIQLIMLVEQDSCILETAPVFVVYTSSSPGRQRWLRDGSRRRG